MKAEVPEQMRLPCAVGATRDSLLVMDSGDGTEVWLETTLGGYQGPHRASVFLGPEGAKALMEWLAQWLEAQGGRP